MTYSNTVLSYLERKQLTPDTASKQQLSDALAYEVCYNWYIQKQKVQESTAEISAHTFIQKYALHDIEGFCLEQTPEDMWARIANVLAEEEVKTNPTNKDYTHWYNEFMSILTDFKYSPQGSGLYSLGNSAVKASASNCFVVPSPSDSLESIFDTAKYMARIYAARGGVGVDISGLRPFGAITNNAAKSSTGAASFMDFYSHVTSTIGQAGRRGALMLSIRVDHPDIFRFIEMKRDFDKRWFFNELNEYGIDINNWKYSAISDRLKSTSHANVSVRLTDKFIKAVENDEDFELYFDFDNNQYPRISNIVKARDIWDKLVEGATESAEPGMLNWDRIISESPADCYSEPTAYTMPDGSIVTYSFKTLSTNPCGELPLSAGDSCCLGTHNLTAFIRDPYTNKAKFDWMEFKRVVYLSTRAQDNIKNIDIDLVPLEINKQSAILGRRIGLGCTGLSDALAMLGIRYDSDEAIKVASKIYSNLRDIAYASSVELAAEKGAFLAYDAEKEKNHPYLSRLPKELQGKPRRNIALLTNAPNGSMAIIMNNGSSGIEPCFNKEYTRNVKIPGTNDVRQFQVYHQPIADCIAAGGDPSVFVEANNVSGEMRIKLQAAIQKYIDHSISVTTNLPAGTTKERVSELYLQAFKEGCKGFTVYVDGSRTGVLNTIKEPVKIHKTLERPKTTNIDIHKVKYKDKQWAVLVGRADNGPLEVFAGIEEETPLPNKYHRAELTKKSRGHYSLTVFLSEDEDDLIKISNIGARFPSPEGMTLTRFISLSLKHGVPVSDICEQLTKSSNSMFDYPAVLNRVLKNYVSEDEYAKKNGEKKCPDCGGALTFRKVDGCMVEICGNCNYTNSKCG